MKQFFLSFLSLLLMLIVFAANGHSADTEMKHTPYDYFVSGSRIQLDVDVRDPGGIDLVRCYFKASGEANLVFVPMNPAGTHNYTGILPAPSASTGQIEYLFLAVNGANQVVRSQSFFIGRNDQKEKPAWQMIPKDQEVLVSMEIDAVPEELPGFSDSIAIDMAESGARFGVVVLLYDASQAGGAGLTGSAASATSAGSITAEAAGFSTTTMVAAGAVGAAVIAGGAVAAGGGSGGGDKAEDLTETTILGNWKVKGAQLGYSIDGTFIFDEDNVFKYDTRSISPTGEPSLQNGTGTWRLTGSSLTFFYPVAAGTTLSGNADGDSRSFVFVCDDGVCNLNFKR